MVTALTRPQTRTSESQVHPVQPYGWLPALLTAVAFVGLLLSAGTAVTDLVRYAGYLLWAVVLPGTLLYRSLRRTPHSLVDDVAMGTALGLVLEIAAYAAASTVGVRGALWLWPAGMVTAFLTVPALRRHWRPVYDRRVPRGWAWAVALVSTWFTAYLTFAFLRANQPVPTGAGQRYFIDELYFLSVVGEAKHHFPLTTPSVAGETLHYHWFSYAHMAVASLISGVDVPVVLFRFAVPVLGLLAVVLLAVAGWRLTGRPWVGVGAIALTFAIGELTQPGLGLAPLGAIFTFYSWSSPSVLYGAVLGIPLMVLIGERLRGAASGTGGGGVGSGPGGWVLLATFAFAAPGGKSTVLPIAIAGVALVCLVQLVHRRPSAVPWLVGGLLIAAQVTALTVLYRFESHTLRFGPLSHLLGYLGTHDRPWWKDGVLLGFAFGAYLICICTRLAGIPALIWLHRREWTDRDTFLTGGVCAGFAGSLLLTHNSWSQVFFAIAGWPYGAILSAAGLAALVDRYRLTARTVAFLVTGALAVAAVLPALVWRPEVPLGLRVGYLYLVPVWRLGLAVGGVALAIVVGGWMLRRWWPVRGTPVAVLCFVLAAGAPWMAWDALANPNAGRHNYHLVVTPAQAEAARWLRDHSRPDDLVATNVHRLPEPRGFDISVSYWISGFTERRVLVESWGYTARAYREAAGGFTSYHFWDAELLAANDAAITDSTPERLTWLRERGVRWILVDRRFGAESPALRQLADLRVERDGVAVYKI